VEEGWSGDMSRDRVVDGGVEVEVWGGGGEGLEASDLERMWVRCRDVERRAALVSSAYIVVVVDSSIRIKISISIRSLNLNWTTSAPIRFALL